MSNEARIRIDSHRLMREEKDNIHEVRIDLARTNLTGHQKKQATKWKRRVVVHVVVFALSFIFTSGVALLGVLLWVKPDSLFSLVITGVVAGVVFIVSFASLRMFVLHSLLHEYQNREEDPGFSHHVSKSIAYAFVALVLAVVVAGVFVNLASAIVI
jgi:Flp pilus assembly protein TadB